MPFPISQLLERKSSPVTIDGAAKVSEALKVMDANDFSQLPIVSASGILEGLVTTESILRAVRILGLMPDKIRVKDARDKVKRYRDDSDLFDVLEGLSDQFAVVIIDEKGVVNGIITDYDTSNFFRQRAEDIMLVEDIERTLRQYILLAFPNSSQQKDPDLQRAVSSARTPAKGYDFFEKALRKYVHSIGGEPAKVDREQARAAYDSITDQPQKSISFEDLTFSECMTMFLDDERWEFYSSIITLERSAVRRMLDSAREIRNKLAHFKGEVSGFEHDTLVACLSWLQYHYASAYTAHDASSSSKTVVDHHEPEEEVDLPTAKTFDPLINKINVDSVQAATVGPESAPDYRRLRQWLETVSPGMKRLYVKFSDLEAIVGGPLPINARKHQAWWASNALNHPIVKQAREAGWKMGPAILESEFFVMDRTAP